MVAQLPILSTIRNAPVSYFVYSSLSFFGRHNGGELPGMWFVAALEDAGRDLAVIRQTLYRMEKEGELVARKDGRTKYYRASRFADAEIDAGLAHIFQPQPRDWDGEWTIVHLNLRSPGQRIIRERVVALLAVEGFALAGSDFYIHPRDVGGRITEALPPSARPHVIVLRGPLQDEASAESIVALWQMKKLAQRYQRVHGQLLQLETALQSGITDREAFLMRFALVFGFLGVAWDDPGLPREVLPADWPGEETRQLAARLYERIAPRALRYAARLLAQTAPSKSHSAGNR
jgi:phenylacetic acid degradation operon negative regulatory protein